MNMGLIELFLAVESISPVTARWSNQRRRVIARQDRTFQV